VFDTKYTYICNDILIASATLSASEDFLLFYYEFSPIV